MANQTSWGEMIMTRAQCPNRRLEVRMYTESNRMHPILCFAGWLLSSSYQTTSECTKCLGSWSVVGWWYKHWDITTTPLVIHSSLARANWWRWTTERFIVLGERAHEWVNESSTISSQRECCPLDCDGYAIIILLVTQRRFIMISATRCTQRESATK